PSLLRAPPTPATDTLSLHDALPIFVQPQLRADLLVDHAARHPGEGVRPRIAQDHDAPRSHVLAREALEVGARAEHAFAVIDRARSEEHTSELQSRENLVCRRLLEKK